MLRIVSINLALIPVMTGLLLLAFTFSLDQAVADELGLPGVSAPNGKASIFGGADDEDGIIYGSASYSIPLSHRYGLQIDGLFGHVGRVDDELVQGAAHLFWRDPGVGLIGLYGSVLGVSSDEMYRIGGEGHLYLGQISLEGMLGWDEASVDGSLYVSGTLAYYHTDDLRLFGGVKHSDWQDDNIAGVGTVGFAGFEYQLASSDTGRAYSLFAEARIGENDYAAGWGGLRVYFGPHKSLKRRHREDDPFTVVPDLEMVTQPQPPAPVIIDDVEID